jgi:hypothetical protein
MSLSTLPRAAGTICHDTPNLSFSSCAHGDVEGIASSAWSLNRKNGIIFCNLIAPDDYPLEPRQYERGSTAA